MKTDNSNIVSNSEIKMPEWDIFKYNSRLEWAKDCFEKGQMNKEEQLKPLIESHAELLKALVHINIVLSAKDMHSNIVKQAIENATKLIKL